MKYLIPIFLILSSCTSPQFVCMKDKAGNPIHTTTPNPFFSTPNQASEWSFWYIIVLAIVAWTAWREFKSVKWPSKKSSDSGASKPTDSV
jgi:hypothetical protein